MRVPAYPEYKDSGVTWLGEVPSHWPVQRITNLYREVVEAGNDDLPILSVSIHSGVSDDELAADEVERKVSRSDDRSKYKQVQPNDLVYNMMRAWQGGFGAVQVPGMVSPAYVVARPKGDVPSRYVELLLRTPGAVEEMRRRSRGVTDFRLRLYWDEFKDMRIALPPSAERQNIVAFLDRETAKIDGLVAEQERLIALLKEKRQAVISHAVTKGLNPNAPMKESGIEWLGQTPAHWDVVPLKRVTNEFCDGPFGSGLKSEHYVDFGARVVRLQNIKELGFSDGDSVYVDLDYFYSELTRHAITANDLLIAGLGDDRNLVGRACVAPLDIGVSMVKADCFRFRLDTGVAYPPFVAAQLNVSASFDAGRLATGTTRSRIPLSTMSNRALALPPRDEQTRISQYCSKFAAVFAALTREAETAITLLQERRAALISAAVTGKIDVRTVVSAPELETA